MCKLKLVRDFITDKRQDITEERKVMFEKLQAGGYENKYDYYNRLNETRGERKILKEINSFITFQLNAEKYSSYVDE